MFNPRIIYSLVLAFVWSSFYSFARPNVIVIYTDDQGYADLGVQGSRDDIVTPNIDALALSGVRCTAGYSTSPQCTPSRAGLISGQYQNRFGQETNRHGPMPLNVVTIADRMQQAGYLTGMSGKWHLAVCNYGPDKGKWDSRDPQNPYLPAYRGFEEYCTGILQEYVASHDFDGKPLDGAPVKLETELYRVHAQTAWAEHFIDRSVGTDRPFFLYLSYYAPHVPAVAPEEYMERFAHVKDETRRVGLAMMATVDDGVGRILEKLEQHGIRNNTLIFYISDNGAPGGKGWNGSLNDPLRGWKGSVYEGGVRVPYLVSWPEKLGEAQIYTKTVSTLDVAATALDVAGTEIPEELDGVSLIPFLNGEEEGAPHQSLFWKWTFRTPRRAVVYEDWKWIKWDDNPAELYSLAGDLEEAKNLATQHPEIVEHIQRLYFEWESEMPEIGNPWLDK